MLQTDALTMYINHIFYFDWEVRRLGMCECVKTRNDNGLRFWIFSNICGQKNVSKTNLESTIHYIYIHHMHITCMVSEELRLKEIGLFLQQYRFVFQKNNILFLSQSSNDKEVGFTLIYNNGGSMLLNFRPFQQSIYDWYMESHTCDIYDQVYHILST